MSARPELAEVTEQERFYIAQGDIARKSVESMGLSREKAGGEVAKALGERVQWTSPDGVRFVGTGKSFEALPPGYYDIGVSPQVGIFFEKLVLRTEGLVRFPDSNSDRVLEELKKFLGMEARFKAFHLPFKRGMMLMGPPGSGKTTLVAQVLEEVINREGIALKFSHPDTFINGMKIIRSIQPDLLVVVVMEDLDTLVKVLGESAILNVLDGAEDINRVVFLATTNFPELLGQRIINRPSRFDKRFEIPHPSAEGRRVYIENLAARADHDPFELDLWVEKTDGMSMAHIKELWVAVQVLGDKFENAIEILGNMMKKKVSSEHFEGRGTMSLQGRG